MCAFRRQFKRLQEEAKDKGEHSILNIERFKRYLFTERFYLVYWIEEQSVSVHPQSELKEPRLEDCVKGASCTVAIRKKDYVGTIACRGT